MQPAPGRADTDPEPCPGALGRKPEQVNEHDHVSLRGGQVSQGLSHDATARPPRQDHHCQRRAVRNTIAVSRRLLRRGARGSFRAFHTEEGH